MGTDRSALELGLLAAFLILAAFAAFLSRSTERQPDWPPSPTRTRVLVRDLIVTGAGVIMLIAGVGLGLLVLLATIRR